jgi:hypothetical protein
LTAPQQLDQLLWFRPKAWSMEWELRKGEEVMGTMSSPRFFGTTVHATINGRHFDLRKGGLRHPDAVIATSEGDDRAVLKFDALGKGTIAFHAGTTFDWTRAVIGDEWTISREGEAVMSVRLLTNAKYPYGEVTVRSQDPLTDELILLVWFLIYTSEC